MLMNGGRKGILGCKIAAFVKLVILKFVKFDKREKWVYFQNLYNMGI